MPKKNIMLDFRIDEMSAVDRPAQKGAKMAIMKRDDSELSTAITKYYYGTETKAVDFVSALKVTEDNKRLWDLREELSPLIEAVSRAINTTLGDKELTMDAKRARIEQSADAFVTALRDKMPEIEDDLAKALTANDLGTTEAAIQKESQMADEKQAEVVKALEAELAKAQTLAKMSDAEKAYADKLDDKAKAAFMASDEESRKKQMAKAEKADKTVEVEGEIVSKSDVGEKAFAAFEKMAALEARMAKAEESAANLEFEKRASAELPHVTGTLSAKAEILKSIDAMPEGEGKEALAAILKAANEANAADMVNKGVSGDAGEGSDSLDTATKAVMKRDAVSYEKAMAIALDEDPSLYNQKGA